jgi:hypothetical protein
MGPDLPTILRGGILKAGNKLKPVWDRYNLGLYFICTFITPGKEKLENLEKDWRMHSTKKSRMSTQTVPKLIKAKRARRTGSALIEVIIAAAILILALIGYSSSFVSGRKQILKQRQYQMAVHLTSQRVEEIKAGGYLGATVAEQEEELYLDGLTCTRTTLVELTAEPSGPTPQPLKKVTVTTSWTGMAQDPHQIKLVTYIGP